MNLVDEHWSQAACLSPRLKGIGFHLLPHGVQNSCLNSRSMHMIWRRSQLNLKCTPRVPLILFTCSRGKNRMWILILFCSLTHNWKSKWRIRTIWKPNKCTTITNYSFFVSWIGKFWLETHIMDSFRLLCVLTCTIRKLKVATFYQQVW